MINITDALSATSETRLAPIFRDYSKNNAIFSEPNPLGSNGNFKTIRTNYNMNIIFFKAN